MTNLKTTGMLGLAALVTTGLVAWQAPTALASHGSGSDDDAAFKRDDHGQVLVTTVDDDDDDDTGTRTGTSTRTRTGHGGDTGTNAGTNTGTRTRGGQTDHSRGGAVRDLTTDGPGGRHVDHSRHHTNDRSRHDTRG